MTDGISDTIHNIIRYDRQKIRYPR